MKSLKILLAGIVIGGIAGFPMGINFGKGEPLLSNPFEKRSIKRKVKKTVDGLTESARERIHDATKPVRREVERNWDR